MKFSTQKNSREVNNRRTWTLAEGKALIDSYYLIIADGYKQDNIQYKNGYMLELEKYMIKAFPNTDLREKPHIESKIKTWKKQWGLIYSALATSGIAWNASKKMLNIEDDDVWTQLCKRDSELHKLRNKPMDWYDDWQRIFGNDITTGEHVEGPADILKNLDKEECETVEFSCSTDNSPGNDKNKKKAKLQDELLTYMDKMQENVENFLIKTAQQLEVMTQKMGYEHELAKARREVYDIINNINNLTKQDKLKAAAKIVSDPADVDLFFSLPEEMREECVRMKLGGHI